MGDGRYYFGAGDPQFIIEHVQGKTLDIEIEVLKEQEARKNSGRNSHRYLHRKSRRSRD